MSEKQDEPKQVSPPSRKSLALVVLALVVWYTSVLFLCLGRSLFPNVIAGEQLTRLTVWISLLYYFPAVMLLLRFGKTNWPDFGTELLGLTLWMGSWLAYLIHVVMAFRYYHHWSHADAFEHTEARSGFGYGIYVNYVFTILWTGDVFWWACFPTGYQRRPQWVGWSFHASMVFIVVNATIVFADGPIRWIGVIGFVWLAWLWYIRWLKVPE
ncbi:MAG: hypothetical protein ACFCD0_07310 [Gemmataceae bacterium]